MTQPDPPLIQPRNEIDFVHRAFVYALTDRILALLGPTVLNHRQQDELMKIIYQAVLELDSFRAKQAKVLQDQVIELLRVRPPAPVLSSRVKDDL